MRPLRRRAFIQGLAAASAGATLRPRWALGQPVPVPTFTRTRRSITEEPAADLPELARLLKEYATSTITGAHNLHNCAHGFGPHGLAVFPGNGTSFLTWHRTYIGAAETHLASHQRTLPSWAPWETIPAPFLSLPGTLRQPAPPKGGWEQAFILWSDELIGFWTSEDAMATQLSWSVHLKVHMACGGEMAVVDTAPYAPIFWPWHAFIDDIFTVWQRKQQQPPPRPPAVWPWADQEDNPPGSGDTLTPWCYGLTRAEAEKRIRAAGLVVRRSNLPMRASDRVAMQSPRPFTRLKRGVGEVKVWGMLAEDVPPTVVRPLDAFEMDLQGPLTLRLEGGTVSYGQLGVALTGSASLAATAAPEASVALRNASLTIEQAPCPVTPAQPHTSPIGIPRPPVVGPGGGRVGGTVGATSPGYFTVAGGGTLELHWGGLDVSIPGVRLTTGSDGALGFTGGDVALGGCTHQAGTGSRLLPNEIVLAGSLVCGHALVAGSALRLTPSGFAGTGQLEAFGHRFDVAYAGGAGALTASGTWQGTSAGWQEVPGMPRARYRIVNPRVSVEVNGAAGLVAALHVDAVEAEAAPPGGNAVRVTLNPPPIAVQADGTVVVPLPALPAQGQGGPQLSGPALCDASCSGLSPYHLAALVSSGTGFGNAGKIVYDDPSQGACHVEQRSAHWHGPLDGTCQADTKCPPGLDRVQDSGEWNCHTRGGLVDLAPLPSSVTSSVEKLVR